MFFLLVNLNLIITDYYYFHGDHIFHLYFDYSLIVLLALIFY